MKYIIEKQLLTTNPEDVRESEMGESVICSIQSTFYWVGAFKSSTITPSQFGFSLTISEVAKCCFEVGKGKFHFLLLNWMFRYLECSM